MFPDTIIQSQSNNPISSKCWVDYSFLLDNVTIKKPRHQVLFSFVFFFLSITKQIMKSVTLSSTDDKNLVRKAVPTSVSFWLFIAVEASYSTSFLIRKFSLLE